MYFNILLIRYWFKALIFLAYAARLPRQRPCYLNRTLVFRTRYFALWKFRDGIGEPMLVGPPNAGHYSWIAWFAPGKSIVEMLMRWYPENPVYSIEWLPAPEGNQGIDDIVNDVHMAVNAIGGRAHLVGLCMCGWLFNIYRVLFPEKVLSLTTDGTPLNTDGGVGGKIYEIARNTPIEVFRAMAPDGIWRGALSIASFKGLTPEKANEMYVKRYRNLWQAIDNDDDEALERYLLFWDWMDDPSQMSWKWMEWIIVNHFKTNRLYRGECEVLSRKVDFKKGTCRQANIAGGKDDITMKGEVIGAIPGAYEMVIEEVGHIGLYISSKALSQSKKAFDWTIKGIVPSDVTDPSVLHS